jgi:hypothetical protein
MAEWFKATVLKTVERKLRGFESYSLRQYRFGVVAELAEGGGLLNRYTGKTVSEVRILSTPPSYSGPFQGPFRFAVSKRAHSSIG